MIKTLSIAWLFLTAATSVLAADAPAYQWTDSSGVVHFTQELPPAGVQYQRVLVSAPGPAAGSEVDSAVPAKKPDAAQPGLPAEDLAATEALNAARTKAERQQACKAANDRIAYLEEKTARRLFRPGPNNEPVRYTEEEFQEKMQEAKQLQLATCS